MMIPNKTILSLLSIYLLMPSSGLTANESDIAASKEVQVGAASCFGAQQRYRFLAERWRAEGDDPWNTPPFNLANVFDFDLLQESKVKIDSAVILFDKNSEVLRLLFYSQSGLIITESRERVEVQQCERDQSVLKTKGSLSGDGGRVSKQTNIRLMRLSDGVRIETKVQLTSSFLLFSRDWKRNYLAEFKTKDAGNNKEKMGSPISRP